MVPEEGSLTPSINGEQQQQLQYQTGLNGPRKSPDNSEKTPGPVASPRRRTLDTLSNIKSFGSISASSDQINKIPAYQSNTLPANYKKSTSSQEISGILKPVSQFPMTTFGNQKAMMPYSNTVGSGSNTFQYPDTSYQQDNATSELTLSLKKIPAAPVLSRSGSNNNTTQYQYPRNANIYSTGNTLYKSHDSGISSNGFQTIQGSPTYQSSGSNANTNGTYHTLPKYQQNTTTTRGQGDGSEEYHASVTRVVQEKYPAIPSIPAEKYPMEPPEVPPRDYTTDDTLGDNTEGKQLIWFPPAGSMNPLIPDPDDEDLSDQENGGSGKLYDGARGPLGIATIYKLGSRTDLVLKDQIQNKNPTSTSNNGSLKFKVVDDYSAVKDEKPNYVFGKSESVIDDEGKLILNT